MLAFAVLRLWVQHQLCSGFSSQQLLHALRVTKQHQGDKIAHLSASLLRSISMVLPSSPLASPHPSRAAQVTKQNLADKIAQLNAAIDDVSSQLNARDSTLSKDEAMAQ